MQKLGTFAKTNKKQLTNVLKILVSVGLIAFILSAIDVQKLGVVLANANPLWLIPAILFSFGGVLARVRRWKELLDSLSLRVSFWELTQIYFVGFLFNNLLPSGLGGDAIRMMELNRHSERAGDSVTSVLVDRFVGLFASLSLALIALIFRWNAVPPELAIFSVATALGLLVTLFILINKPLYDGLRRWSPVRKVTDIKFITSLFRSFQDYRPAVLARAYVWSLLLSVCLIGMNAGIGAALGAEISLVPYMVFVPLASIVLILPISFAGLGTRELAYVYLFGQVGVPEEIAFGLSLLVYFIGNALPGLTGGAIYIWRGAKGIRMTNDE